jgi:Malectin domain
MNETLQFTQTLSTPFCIEISSSSFPLPPSPVAHNTYRLIKISTSPTTTTTLEDVKHAAKDLYWETQREKNENESDFVFHSVSVKLQFQDEEGDYILVSNDHDWENLQSITSCSTPFNTTIKKVFATVLKIPAASKQEIGTNHNGYQVRINCGGGEYIDKAGNKWEGDLDNSYFDGGWAHSNKFLTIAGTSTTDDTIYQSERAGCESYCIKNVPNGYVTVKLHYAEIVWFMQNTRLFNVDIEGTTVATDYDILKNAGGSRRAIIETYEGVRIENGAVTIAFTAVKDNAKISGIEIFSAS